MRSTPLFVLAALTLGGPAHALDVSRYSAPIQNGTNTYVTAPSATVARTLTDRAAEQMSVRDFGALGYPNNDTVAVQKALDWLAAVPSRKLIIPMGVWLVDGLSLDACNRCWLEGDAATLLWSANAKIFTDAGTGLTYPQSVLLIRGDQSVNRNGRIDIGFIDGWNLAADGLFVAAGYAHRIRVGSIWFARYGLNYSPHMNYGSETEVNVGLIKHVVRGIYEAPDYLYALQNKSQYYFFSHLTENVRFNVQTILDCKEYGIKRDAPLWTGTAQTGSNAINAFAVGAVDCTDYYDRTVDPISTPTPGYYKGGTPISNAPADAPTYPGRTRPPGILAKSTSAPGAIDIRDDYEALNAPTPVTSRSTYQTTYLGNSMQWLVDGRNGGAGLARSNLQTLIQDYTKFGNVAVDGYGGTISVNGTPIADGAGWSRYLPSFACNTGSPGILGATNAWFKRIGKTVLVTVEQAINNNGTCGGYIGMSLPLPAVRNTPLSGRDPVNGWGLTGFVGAGQTVATIQRYDGAYPTSAAPSAPGGLLFSLTYETP